MNMNIEDQREPLNPCTLIALKILTDFIGTILKKDNLEGAEEIVNAQKGLREIEDAYLTDLLWGRLNFQLTDSNPKPPVFPPIFDLLQICSDARIKDMRCEIFVTEHEKHEYQKTVSMGFHRMIKQVLPDGPPEHVQERSLSLWGQLEDGPLFSNLGEADHLCSSLITARQEVINRDHHKDMGDNPHKEPSVTTTDQFIHYNPVHLLFLSAPKQVYEAFTAVLDQYLIDFQKKNINWGADVLPWNRQTVTLFSIFSRKQELFGDIFWFSQKDFSSIDPFVLDGYKPVETLFILARQGRIDVHEADRAEGAPTVRLKIRMNLNVERKTRETKEVKDEKDDGDEVQKAVNQYVTINAKKRILAQIVLDYLVFQDEKGVIVIDPSELIASVPSFSKRGLHDLCQLMVKDGYFKKAEDHYPRAKLERNPWNYMGPSELDHYDRIIRISIVPDVEKLEKLALLAPKESSVELQVPTPKVHTINEVVAINGIEIDLLRQKVSYQGITKQYRSGTLPWRIIRTCASAVPDGVGNVAIENLHEVEQTISRALYRLNQPWEIKGIKIIYMKDGYVHLDPIPITANVEMM